MIFEDVCKIDAQTHIVTQDGQLIEGGDEDSNTIDGRVKREQKGRGRDGKEKRMSVKKN